jgi:pilus assembly protein Flp/PilA
MRNAQKLWKETQGQDLVEYALAAGLVAVAAVATMGTLGADVSNAFSAIGSIIASAMG